MTGSSDDLRRRLALLALAATAVLIGDGILHHLLAQTPPPPFGGARPPAAAVEQGGIIGWLLAKQAEFYRQMSGAIRAAKTDGSAVTTLLGISFLYGIFHAAGPGHGKAVISSYLIANEETARRGVVLSFVSAMLQAVVAVAIVGVAAWLLNATSQAMCSTERIVEIASYGLIALLGARLVWTKGRGFFAALSSRDHDAHAHHHHGHDHHHHDHGHHHHDHDHHHDHQHHHHHHHDDHHGHSHGPEPSELAGPGGWKRGLMAIVAVGLRPCSGAILVLVFALAQGLFWAGIAATFVMALGTAITVATIAVVAVSAKGLAARLSGAKDGSGTLVMRFIEFGAAGLVLLFGVGLLFGYLAAERTTCF